MIETREITKATLETRAAGVLHASSIRAVSGTHLPAAVRRSDFEQHASADGALAEPDRHDHRGVSGRSRPARAPCTRKLSTSGIRAISITSATSGIPFPFSPRRRFIATPRRTFTRSTNSPQQRQSLDERNALFQPVERRMVAAGRRLPLYVRRRSWRCSTWPSSYREQMSYNKYRAARDTIEKFEKEPPYAYIIPREQHDAPTAALLIEKLMLQGIEVHQSSEAGCVGDPDESAVRRTGEGAVRAAEISAVFRSVPTMLPAGRCRIRWASKRKR